MRPWLRRILSPAIIAGISVVCYRVFGVNATTAGFAYLLAILGIAAVWGLVEALLACTVATLSFSYFFLPPVGHLTIADPENWVALFAFLVTALVASHLSDRAKKEAKDAKARQHESELLSQLSQAILMSGGSESAGSQTVRHLARIFDLRSVALYDSETGEVYYGGSERTAGIEPKLMQAANERREVYRNNVVVAPVRTGESCIGSLAAQDISLSNDNFQALLNLVAIALERIRTQAAASRAEVTRQSEEFKSTLLYAVTHEFKTPLTSLKAASTSILADATTLSPHMREMTSVIDTAADRLNLMVTDAVRMAQLDASKIHLEKQPIVIKEFLDRVLDQFASRLEERQVSLRLGEALPAVSADPDLASMALRQVIDNGLKYSSATTPLFIAADAAAGGVKIRVRDYGPGIPEDDRERIFDRFYRRLSMKTQVPGSGLGLYIAREIVRAHGGDLWVDNVAGPGSEFCLLFPSEAEART